MKERKRDGDTNALRESVLNQSTSRCMHISEQEAHTEQEQYLVEPEEAREARGKTENGLGRVDGFEAVVYKSGIRLVALPGICEGTLGPCLVLVADAHRLCCS